MKQDQEGGTQLTMNKEVLLRPPRKVTIVESIVGQFVQQIQEGKLNPGDKLPSERQLIDMLGVSRSSVREALQGLMVMGLIEIRPGQGAFVTNGRVFPNVDSPTLSDHLQREMRLQLIEARRTLECPIARLAAERATPEGIARLYQHLEDYKHDPFGHLNKRHSVSPHTAFHLCLAEMSGNQFFVAVVEHLLRAVPITLRSREEVALDDQGVRTVTADEVAMHRAIVEAVERRDGDAAFRAMDDHLDYERRLVLQIFPEDNSSSIEEAE